MNTGIDVRLLGPLEVVVPDGNVDFEGAKQTAALRRAGAARARAGGGRRARGGRLGDQAPDSREQALQKQVSRLRARLGEHLPVRLRASGYALEIERERIDSRRFEALLEAVRAERSSVAPARAATQLAAALALWRGPALADHAFDEFAQSDIARLEELRLEAIEERLAADLGRGQAVDVVGELASAGRRAPAARAAARQLMLALYRAGRQADALNVMREGRRLLVDELGLEPGPELRLLQVMILAHDPELRAEGSTDVLEAPFPAPANATIGREGELAEIGALLMRPEVRLLTLVGAGGVGKTRLALEASRAMDGRFPGGAAYADLAGAEGVLVTAAAAALGVMAETAAESSGSASPAPRAERARCSSSMASSASSPMPPRSASCSPPCRTSRCSRPAARRCA